MSLTEDQISHIDSELQHSAIKSKELRDDLLDHFCCAIEIYMAKGHSFENSFVKAKQDVCPDGLDEIQKETIYLLNSKRIKIMKKLMFSVGLIFSMTMSMGFLFKIMHWPGANNLLILGTVGMGFLFLPMVTLHLFRLKANQILSEKAKYLLGLGSGLLFTLSVVFKQFQLMGANTLFILSIVIFTFGFLPFLFFRMYKKSV